MRTLEKGQKVKLNYKGREVVFEVKFIIDYYSYRLFNKYYHSFNADLNFINNNLCLS